MGLDVRYFGHDDGGFSADYLDELQLSIVSFVSSDVAWIWGYQNRSVGLIGDLLMIEIQASCVWFRGAKGRQLLNNDQA